MRARVLTLALFAAVALAIGHTPAAAQAVGTATIQGRVDRRIGAAAVPGVTVTISSPALQLRQVTEVTQTDGQYRFADIPIGVYRVQYDARGLPGRDSRRRPAQRRVRRAPRHRAEGRRAATRASRSAARARWSTRRRRPASPTSRRRCSQIGAEHAQHVAGAGDDARRSSGGHAGRRRQPARHPAGLQELRHHRPGDAAARRASTPGRPTRPPGSSTTTRRSRKRR